MQLIDEFFDNSTIKDNSDTRRVMEYLTLPESVNLMIAATKMGYPALVGVVKELERRFGNCRLFPLNHNAVDYNAPNRRNVGWMIRFVMRAYGYTPIESGLPNATSDRTRVGKTSKYFGTAAIYEKTVHNPKYEIVVTIKEN